jgi:hypothetical protein
MVSARTKHRIYQNYLLAIEEGKERNIPEETIRQSFIQAHPWFEEYLKKKEKHVNHRRRYFTNTRMPEEVLNSTVRDIRNRCIQIGDTTFQVRVYLRKCSSHS